LIPRKLALLKSSLLLSAVLGLSGCGGSAADTVSGRAARSLASDFANVLVRSPNKQAAIQSTRRTAGPAVVDDVRLWYEKSAPDEIRARAARFHLVVGPRSGCPQSSTEPFTVPAHGHCYRFQLVGEIVPDPINAGLGVVASGELLIWISARRPAKVEHFMYTGGANECQLAVNCRAIRREALRQARKANDT
jgi:hypothetical protein